MSESVAPWLIPIGVLCAVGVIVMLTMLVYCASGELRWFIAFFMALISFVGFFLAFSPKRLLFLCPFMLVTLAGCLYTATGTRGRLLRGIALSLLAVSWVCIVSRTGYAATHTIEPWRAVAADALGFAERGVYVVSNSPSFHFYLAYDLKKITPPGNLQKQEIGSAGAPNINVVRIEEFREADATRLHRVRLYRGVNSSVMTQTSQVLGWLKNNCEQRGEEQLQYDSGFALKSRIFPSAGQEKYRLVVYDFTCPVPSK